MRCCAARTRSASGAHQLPTFDLARTRYVIAFGADFLGTWNSPVAHSVAYGRMRQGGRCAPQVRARGRARVADGGECADEFVAMQVPALKASRARPGVI